MFFHEKLDWLMKITDTSNSRLARIANLDNSFISRLRHGVRTPSRKENYLKIFADYFAKHLTLDYQKSAFCEAANLRPGTWPSELSELSVLINKWLADEQLLPPSPVESFVEGLSMFAGKKGTPMMPLTNQEISEGLNFTSQAYFGNQGKRDAVINFLSLVLAQKKPSTLLLHSEEDMQWLMEKPEFLAKWATLMSHVIARGHRIKIIHTVNRSLDEMLSAISQWLPLYMSGAIEPYYYPKHRDGVFKRTLFVAPETAAVVSKTIGEGGNNTNYLFTDRAILFSLLDEFNSYLALCRPLVHIFTKPRTESYLAALAEFESEHANSIIKAPTLSAVTLPLKLVPGMLTRCTNPNKKIEAYQRKRIINFEQGLASNSFTELISLPDIADVQAGHIRISLADMIADGDVFYSPEEYALHLQNIVRLLETYDNYHVYLERKNQTDNIMLYTKEEIGTIIAKCEPPAVMFAINESNMTAAFWDFMQHKVNRIPREQQRKPHVIAQLQEYIQRLISDLI